MIICKVVGNVWATKKEESLSGSKLRVVQRTAGCDGKEIGDCFVAGDVVGAGIGEYVLVVNGSTARKALGGDHVSIDAAIVGIIDSVEMDRRGIGSK